MPISRDIFKAYDIRGVYPAEINEEAVDKIVRVLDKYFKKSLPAGRQGKIIIGRDARLSSPALYKTALAALDKTNKAYKIIKAGMITTPMLYFLVNKLKAAAGIMITASHNPKQYNGLKVVRENAKAISGKEIYKLVIKSLGH